MSVFLLRLPKDTNEVVETVTTNEEGSTGEMFFLNNEVIYYKVNLIIVDSEENIFNRAGITCPSAYATTLKDFGGCYTCSSANNYYMGEIRFPGTWVNNKTGDISFTLKTGDWRKFVVFKKRIWY